VWFGECFFWYQLTRIIPDKIQGAVKRLCVCERERENWPHLTKESVRLFADILHFFQQLIGLSGWDAVINTMDFHHTHARTHARTHTHRFTALWTLSGITWVSRYQNQSGFYWSMRQWVALASAGQICTLTQTDNHTTTQFLLAGCMPFLLPNQHYQSTEGIWCTFITHVLLALSFTLLVKHLVSFWLNSGQKVVVYCISL